MCGIIGAIGRDLSSLDHQKILKGIKHRGPDSFGIFCENNCFIGHQRLSVIDTSSKSSQPMHFKNYVIAFNGAIYNYKEIRDELQKKGYSFFSEGDTEVILKSFDNWGFDCVKKFNGMFAFVIWDKLKQKLFLARDRFGIKPLYYIKDNNGIKFSSTLPSLLNFENVDKTINKRALHNYMVFHSVVPAPDTILNGVKKLSQSTTMEYDLKSNNILIHEPYWNLDFKYSQNIRYEEQKELLFEKINESVKKRLVSDVETGVLLSGGLDSSFLTALVKKYKPELKTFSIGFESSREEKGDEFYFSDLIAKKYRTEHQKIFVSNSSVLRALPAVVKAMSEPMISHDAVGFYLLSQEVSRTTKVVLSGQGADEVFAGYHWYPKIAEANEDFLSVYKKYMFESEHENIKEIFNNEFIEDDYSSQYIKNYLNINNQGNNIDNALNIDINVMLTDDPLKRIDNMSMAWGVETRVPFLDHEVVELAATIPAEFKYKNGGKLILKDIGNNILPEEILLRPKAYFPLPALRYIKDDFLYLIKEIIDSYESRQRNIFNRKYIDRILKTPNDYITKLGTNILWQIALLEIWFQENNI